MVSFLFQTREREKGTVFRVLVPKGGKKKGRMLSITIGFTDLGVKGKKEKRGKREKKTTE